MASRINAATGGSGTNTDGAGLYIATRTGPNAADDVLSRNGITVIRTGSLASAAPAGELSFLGRGGSTAAFSAKRQAVGVVATGWTPEVEVNFRLQLTRYLRDVGAVA